MAQFDECQFDEELFVACLAIIEICLIAQVHGTVEEGRMQLCRTLSHLRTHSVRSVDKRQRRCVRSHRQVAQILGKTTYEKLRVETLVAHFLIDKQSGSHIAGDKSIDKPAVVAVVEDIEILDGRLVRDISPRACCNLVENRQGIAHGAVSLAGYHIERRRLGGISFVFRHLHHVLHHIVDGDAVEVVDLAARKDSRDYLVLLRCGKDEDSVCRRLFERFQEGVERLRRQHVHFIDDEHAVASVRRRHEHLLHERLDIVDAVVRGGVELDDVQRAVLVELAA